MKLTLNNIKAIKRESDNPLTKYVCNYVINEWHDYSDKANIFKDVLYMGCPSCLMTAYKGIALYKRCVFLQVRSHYDGVLAEFIL